MFWYQLKGVKCTESKPNDASTRPRYHQHHSTYRYRNNDEPNADLSPNALALIWSYHGRGSCKCTRIVSIGVWEPKYHGKTSPPKYRKLERDLGKNPKIIRHMLMKNKV